MSDPRPSIVRQAVRDMLRPRHLRRWGAAAAINLGLVAVIGLLLLACWAPGYVGTTTSDDPQTSRRANRGPSAKPPGDADVARRMRDRRAQTETPKPPATRPATTRSTTRPTTKPATPQPTTRPTTRPAATRPATQPATTKPATRPTPRPATRPA